MRGPTFVIFSTNAIPQEVDFLTGLQKLFSVKIGDGWWLGRRALGAVAAMSFLGVFQMQPFLGDLLMGGIRLRDLCGLFKDIPAGHESIWSGHFSIDAAKRGLFELGRPYMLMLDDGRSGHVVVTHVADDSEAIRVEFQPAV